MVYIFPCKDTFFKEKGKGEYLENNGTPHIFYPCTRKTKPGSAFAVTLRFILGQITGQKSALICAENYLLFFTPIKAKNCYKNRGNF